MGKVLVQCGASEEARAGLPPAPRSSAPPLEDAKPEPVADGTGAEGEAAADAAPDAAKPAEVGWHAACRLMRCACLYVTKLD